jgi:c-di-GMP-binding flagellar brake protein YcgR
MERRVNDRLAANYSAQVRYRAGRKLELPVLDISLGGCMLEARGWSIRPGEQLSIKLPGLGYLPAEVVWIEEERAGIAFDEALYEPTLEHLSSLAA